MVLGQKVASLYAEIGLKSDQLERGLTSSKKSLNGLKTELVGFAGDVAKGSLLLGGLAVSAKKAFDLAAEGAQIKQTHISFKNLIESIGVAPDLLDKLKMAARGTVDEISLMSSTTMLLAGAEGDLAKSLAEASPQLLKIADAANMLNPTLGDTTFFYNSLATGIKRASPLLIDNLGITVNITEANEAYAKSLGITVSQLTKDQQSQALLNAVLAKGDNIIKQAGNGAASLTDSYEALNVATKELADSLKVTLYEALTPLAEATAEFLRDSINFEKSQRMIDKAVKDHILTQREAGAIENELRFRRMSDAEVLALLNKRYQHLDDQLNYQNETNLRLIVSTKQVSTELKEYDEAQMAAGKATRDSWAELMKYQDQQYNAAIAAEAHAEAAAKVAIGITDITRAAAGREALEKLHQAYVDGKIAEDEYERSAQNIMKVMLGMPDSQIVASLALRDLQEDLEEGKITALEYVTAVVALGTEMDKLDGKRVTAEIELYVPQLADETKIGGLLKAEGGPVYANQPYIVGEEGPELFIPSQSGEIISNKNMQGFGTSNPINITINGSVTNDNVYTLAKQIGAELNRQGRYA